MIKAEDILNATHGGLDIILDCYPQAKDCVNAKSTSLFVTSEPRPRAFDSMIRKNMAVSGK